MNFMVQWTDILLFIDMFKNRWMFQGPYIVLGARGIVVSKSGHIVSILMS